MCEMLGYIFGSLRSSETAIKGIRVTLKHQSRFNRNVGLWACAMTAYVVMTELDRREQDKKIKELRNEIEELKRSEGE